MRRKGDYFLAEEYAFMDAKVKRCPKLKTLGLEVYHPLFKKVIWLARMECESENGNTVSLFLRLFNSALSDHKGESVKFLPFGWMLDEGGGLHAGVTDVYGEEEKARIVSCRLVTAGN